jgi:hypothetical protein
VHARDESAAQKGDAERGRHGTIIFGYDGYDRLGYDGYDGRDELVACLLLFFVGFDWYDRELDASRLVVRTSGAEERTTRLPISNRRT